MREVKVRLRAIRTSLAIIEANANNPTMFVHAEYGYLQIRFVCELVALAAVIAHHESPETGSIMAEWNADIIFKRLSEINEKCYPQALMMETRKPLQFRFKKGAQLTREQIQAIYGLCGNNLHRGRLKRGADGLRKPYDIPQIRAWTDAFENLLEMHVIMLPHFNSLLLVELGGPNGEVSVRHGQGEEGGSFRQVDDA